ncbi:MAG: CRISPR-associated endonuclease Cas2 [Herpetosiphonaceae bacterium]|nr:CRISPR-associated endonuclease Cas2 [Herpetosiphonaceae bacterium]
MFTIISYDIVQTKRRTRVFKLLKGYGTHVQYSVFECYLNPKQLAAVEEGLRKLIDLQTDSIRLYLLDITAVQRIQVLGIGQVSDDPVYFHT